MTNFTEVTSRETLLKQPAHFILIYSVYFSWGRDEEKLEKKR